MDKLKSCRRLSSGNKKRLFLTSDINQYKNSCDSTNNTKANELLDIPICENDILSQSTPARTIHGNKNFKIKRKISRRSSSSTKKKGKRTVSELSFSLNDSFSVDEVSQTVLDDKYANLNEKFEPSDIIHSETIEENMLNETLTDTLNEKLTDTSNEKLKDSLSSLLTETLDEELTNQCSEKLVRAEESTKTDRSGNPHKDDSNGYFSSFSHLHNDIYFNEQEQYTQYHSNKTSNKLCFLNENIKTEQTSKFDLFEQSNVTKDEQMLANLNLTEIAKLSKKENNHKDSFYGLPMKVKDILLQNRGISTLYDWQNDCLCLPAVTKRCNMIYALPTSGGKTLVAEILIMRELLLFKRNVILVLPYVSIVQEKVRGFSPFAIDLGFHIEEYAASKGSLPPKKRRKRNSVYIATIEKANAIVNSLIELERIHELGMVVVDELHMVGEGGGRGAILEILLSKVLFAFVNTQIIGMSATLGNIDEIKRFLKAEVYESNFRPVELVEYVKIGDTLYLLNKCEEEVGRAVRKITHPKGLSSSLASRDPDHILPLILEVIPQNSCLVFCSTKKNCESVALLLAKSLPKEMADVKKNERKQLLMMLQSASNGMCKILSLTVLYGIAYHHSGLTMDERKVLEEAYSTGVLCVLCCTSTLAAGVNLPAKRVILRSPYIGKKIISRSQYKQMVGRAGRAGIDSSGESILILQKKDKMVSKSLLDGPITKCQSSLFYQDGKGLRQLILSLLGLKVCSCGEEMQLFVQTTLFHVQERNNADFDVMSKIRTQVDKLIELGLAIRQTSGGIAKYEITSLGTATLKGCMDIDRVPFLYKQLKTAQEGLILVSELHLLYLATPLDQVDSVHLNWMLYYQLLNRLTSIDVKTAECIGVSEGLLSRKASGQQKTKFDEFIYKRFFLTLMLYELMKRGSIWKVSETFHTTRGFIQNLLSSTISFTSLLIHFTEELSEFWMFKLLFQAFIDRLTHTNNFELAPLLEIPGVKQARARQLFKRGYRNLKDLSSVDPTTLCNNIEYLPRKQAQLIIASAKMMLQEKIESLREEADEIEGDNLLS